MIIVTGGAGFIGSCMVKHLNDQGMEDILIVDNLGRTPKWKNLVDLRYVDYVDKEEFIHQVNEGLSGDDIEAVIHLGACSSTTELDASYLMENNYRYSQTLAIWCDKFAIRYIYASSAATYGNGEQGYADTCDINLLRPLNAYGYSKQAFDQWMLRQGFLEKSVGLKFFNVYGPREAHKDDMRSVIHKSYGQILNQGFVQLFKSHREGIADGDQRRDFVYVADACKVIDFFLHQNKKAGGLYNLGTGQARSFKDLVTATFMAMEREPNIQFIDMPQHLREKYQYFTQADMAKLQAAGYKEPFYSLEAGVKDYVQNHIMHEA